MVQESKSFDQKFMEDDPTVKIRYTCVGVLLVISLLIAVDRVRGILIYDVRLNVITWLDFPLTSASNSLTLSALFCCD